MPEHAAGCAVWQRTADGALQVLLICDKQGVWTLPKGHLEGDETEAEAAEREVAEETGVRCAVGSLLSRLSYPVYKKGRWRKKVVAYFLATAQSTTLTPATDEGISEARWCDPDVAFTLIGYVQIGDVVRAALDLVQQDKSCEIKHNQS